MTTPPWDEYFVTEDGQVHYPIATINRDLNRLGELARPYLADGEDDYAPAVARIPDEGQRREAGELLERLRPVIGPHLDSIDEARPEPCGLHSV